MANLSNYIAGDWQPSRSDTRSDVINPATRQTLGRVLFSSADEVDQCVQSARQASNGWRETPVTERVQPLFRLKTLLEANIESLARSITDECGKTYAESLGELRRGIENVEVACGTPSLIQGTNNEDIARGIDEHMIRQPLGVVAAITPFNFPAMIPLWFLPYAVATGNCFILKPSEKVPLTASKLFELIDQCGFPTGVLQLIHGGRETVDAILDHPSIKAVSFVGSTPVAKYVYSRAAASGKRAQCQGGAKNPVVIMPDAEMETTSQILADSAFGCAGQRCLALSVAVTVGEARKEITDRMCEVAKSRAVGYGLDDGVEMGPVITDASKDRIEVLIAKSQEEGARILVDGRGRKPRGYDQGHFTFPTILDNVDPEATISGTEVFGPVLSLTHTESVEDAIELVNRRAHGNMACVFTQSGTTARQFRHQADAGNIGINVGVAAPMAFFPFSGWNESFFGDLHAQGRHAIEFYTQTKVIVERWPAEWSRKF